MKIGTIYIVFFSTAVSLVGTMIGALFGISIRKPSNEFLGSAIGFAGGLMLSITIIELIPEATQRITLINAVFFMVIGIIIIFLVDNISKNENNTFKEIAFLVALGLMLHNFPEGIIMGLGFSAGDNLGLKMSILISIHDIPEGIAVAAPLMVTNIRRSKILLYTFLTALPTAVGAWIGIFIGDISDYILGNCLSIAAGIMLYVVLRKMFIESKTLCGKKLSSIGILIGIIFGIFIIKII
ncbi:zinc transporter ZupT [Clostridium tepidiprofundi DSM 19306]|uniref:Zinc transporter ZupT n=1 Tax=Clostridium tepidiprofundi DSM 19306 TaxID=1121338 RepID=A0A151B4S7_9CLOT|nr:ZIP family metal transporter [Clostridium tepidiprofundi]KYH34924.1 zinc transporter ZupT [Clostridium tepidiprofundi DSM 19306]